jgi:polyribonucleotide nucleotidyltransferase
MLRLLLAAVLLPGATALLLPGVRHASAVQRCTAPRACDGLPEFVVELEEPMLDEEITAPAEEVTTAAAAPPAAPDPPAPSMAGSTIAAVPDGEWIISEENGVHSLEVGVAGKTMHFESGLMAKLSSGAVSLQVGGTNVFCAATFERKDDPEPIDFTPLRVDYFERSSSVGRTKGGAMPLAPRPSPSP